MDAQRGRVDDHVGPFLEVGQQAALLKDAVDQTVSTLQGMGPAHRLVPLDEHFVAGVKEQDAGAHPQVVEMAEHG